MLPLLLVALLLLPAVAEAHGPGHGSELARQFQGLTEVRDINNTAMSIAHTGLIPAGTLFLVSGQSGGPGDIRLTLQREIDAENWASIASWNFEAGADTTSQGFVLPSTASYGLLIATDATEWTGFNFYFDHTAYVHDGPNGFPRSNSPPQQALQEECECEQSWHIASPPGGAALFTVDAWKTGQLQVELVEAAAHWAKVTIYEAGVGGRWPADFTALASSTNSPSSGVASPVTHAVTWDAVQGARYHVVVEALQSELDPSRPKPALAATNYVHMFSVHEAAENEPAPAPGLAFAVLVLVGAALVARRK